MRLLKYALFLVLVVLLAWADLPDRLHAERNGARKGELVGYREEKYERRPWIAEVRTTDGEVVRNSDRWRYRWADVGAETEWTRAERVYVGGVSRRWCLYFFLLSTLLLVIVVDGWRWMRSERSGR